MSIRPAAALATCLLAFFAASPGRAMELTEFPAAMPGYHYDAEHVHSGVRWGYASLYRAPVQSAAFKGCSWMSVPTAYGQRFRPVCNAN
jgi:hypothetical protein